MAKIRDNTDAANGDMSLFWSFGLEAVYEH
jgi:hypothetical protein